MIASLRTLLHLWFALVLGVPALAHAVDTGPLLEKHNARQIACASCHKEAPNRKPAGAVCLTCHGDQKALAARSANAKPNPHAPPHLAPGETQDCNDCHHLHQASENACADCHRGFRFNVK